MHTASSSRYWLVLDKKEGELSQGAHPFLFLSAGVAGLDGKISRP